MALQLSMFPNVPSSGYIAPKHVKIRKLNTSSRHEKLRQRFNEIYSTTKDGLRYDFDSVIEKVASEFCFSPRTVKNILKGN